MGFVLLCSSVLLLVCSECPSLCWGVPEPAGLVLGVGSCLTAGLILGCGILIGHPFEAASTPPLRSDRPA